MKCKCAGGDGDLCHCPKPKLEPLSLKMDDLLLMDFRQQYWDQWVEFCKEQGYEPEVEQ